MIGKTILHYRITDRIGEGGMGVVWRAEDIRLGRPVALKMLSERLIGDEDAVRRFEAEARLASSVNHPHIVTIYDIGPFEASRFIAMELVEGGTLRQLLAKRSLTIAEGIELGAQLADALAVVHRIGVIHRDIKPENIYLTADGRAKLGDFGIAKLRERQGEALATMMTGTTEGTILGSPNYLSPEQARGEPVDARTDIFSFAATLYEMVTRRRAFEAESPAEAIARILKEEPPRLTERRPDAPRELEAICLKGLEKNTQYRYQHADEILADLRRLKRDLANGRAPATVATARTGASWRSALAGAGVGLVAGAAIAAGWLMSSPEAPSTAPPARATLELIRVTSQPGLEDEPSWSPDGRNLAFTSDEGGHLGIWIRQIPGERAIRVSAPGVDEAQPAWSPDGNWLAFVSSRRRGGRFGIFLGARPIEFYVHGQGGDLFVMPALGGTARMLAEDAYDPTWSPDSRQLAFRSIRDGSWRLYTVSVDDGRIQPVGGVEPRALNPAWSPDGRWLAYVGGASAATGWDLYVVSASGGAPIRLMTDRTTIALRPVWTRDSRSIIYSSNRGGAVNLWRVSFDPSAPGASGQPDRLTTGIGEDVNPTSAPSDERIAYATVHTAPDIWQIDIATGQVQQLTTETTTEDFPRMSPDGRRLAFYSDRSGSEEVWMADLATGEHAQLSRGGGTQNAWSPDGRTVAYGTPDGLKIVDIIKGDIRVLASDLSAAYPAFARDGRRICFQGWDGKEYRLYVVSAEGGERSVVPTPVGEPGNPSWAPNGQTLYYQLDQFGRRNIWVVDLRSGQSRQLTTGDADDAHPDVSGDGRQILFLRNHRDLHVMPAEGGESRVVHAFTEHNRLIEWPAWGRADRTIVFSIADKTGDLFLLQAEARARAGG